MNIAQLREFFLWSLIINYGVLLLWWGVFALAHDWQYNLCRRLLGRAFHMPMEDLDNLQFAGLALYKLFVFLFFAAPCIALYLIR